MASQEPWIIVDSGLKGVGGHNFTYTQITREALRSRGIDPLVLVNRGADLDLCHSQGFRPVFSRGAYDFAPAGMWATTHSWRRWSGTFGEELQGALPTGSIRVFSHTLGEFELGGWTRVMPSLTVGTELTTLLRRTPGYARMPWWKRSLHPYFSYLPRRARRLAQTRRIRFRLATDSFELSADFEAACRYSVETFPIPLDPVVVGASRSQSRWRSERTTLGYLGDGRAAKGFRLLPGVAAALAETPLRLLAQCVAPGGPDQSFETAQTELSGRPATVELVRARLSREEYGALLAAMDVVLIPYTDPGYRESTSGIFAEAVATGKPVVVPSGTWMSAELARGEGAGLVYPRDREDGLVEACRRVITDFESLSARAASNAARYAARHSPAALVEQLLAGTRE